LKICGNLGNVSVMKQLLAGWRDLPQKVILGLLSMDTT
jgi:hypothetical protein